MSDGEYTIQKDEEEMRADRKRKLDDMIGRAFEAHRREEQISSGMDMVMSAIYMLKGMMAENKGICLDDKILDATKRMLEAAKDITDALITGKKREMEENEEEDDDAEGQTDDVL